METRPLMPTTLKSLLKRGELIRMTPELCKINISDYSFVSSGSFIGALVRMIKGENKKDLMIEINATVDQFIEALNNKDYKIFRHQIIETLEGMKKEGLIRLMKTYSNYPGIVAEIKICIDNINLHLEKK